MTPDVVMTPELARQVLGAEAENLAHLADIRFRVSVELGRKVVPLQKLHDLKRDEVIKLDKLAGQSYEIHVNGRQIGMGEITVINDVLGCRVQRIFATESSPALRAAQEALALESAGGLPAQAEPEAKPVEGMVFIPAGGFRMGADDEDVPESQRPGHSVYLDTYYIGEYPVTNLEYREFVRATGHPAPPGWTGGEFEPGLERHPVVQVTWRDASVYAEWKGMRLPTEAEWEKAARGQDERLYPWGSRFVDGECCNSGNMIGGTTPVDEYPLGKSPYGVWDMAGNVQEWCQDYHDAEFYQLSPSRNPTGPQVGHERVLRAGHFDQTRPGVRTIYRASAPETERSDVIGFRLAQSAG